MGARVRADRGDRRRDPVLLRPQLRAAAGDAPTTCSAPRCTASASPARSPARRSTGSSSTRRSRAPPACGCWRNFAGICAPVPGLILYPAIDIRDGRAVRLVQGDYDRETAFDADPLDAASRWVEQGARALHVVDLDGARAGAPVNIEHVERICEAVERPGPGRRRPARGRRRRGGARAPAPPGRSSARRRSPIRPWSRRWPPSTASGSSSRPTPAPAPSRSRAGSATTGAGVADVIADLARRGVRPFRLHPGRGRRDARGSRPARARSRGRGRGCGRGGADLLGRDRHPRAPARARRPRRCPALGGVIVGRALYEGRFTVAEGERALNGG